MSAEPIESFFHARAHSRACKLLTLLAAVPTLAIAALQPTLAADDNVPGASRAYAIGLWGDLPYSDVQALSGVPNLIADMNAQKLAFVVHDGDLKAGNGTPGSATPTICSNAMYLQGLNYFNALNTAAMVTPGDNDWT